jgi:hypothetical protein
MENEEELNLQIQVLTEERDTARQKEEQLFVENSEKEQEIERIRDGYVWVTDRMNSKEDELVELQEQLEKYQSLLKMTSIGAISPQSSIPSSPKQKEEEKEILKKLYTLAFHEEPKSSIDYATLLTQWIKSKQITTSTSTTTGNSSSTMKNTTTTDMDKENEEKVAQDKEEEVEEEQQYDDDFDVADDYYSEENNNKRRSNSGMNNTPPTRKKK